jgi:hypothetical protein
MGYYANTSWSITYRSPEDRAECERFFASRERRWTDDSATSILEAFGEEAEVYGSDPLSLDGWTGGKYFGDTAMYEAVARHADGTVEIDATDSGDGYELVTLKDGRVTYTSGHVVYDGIPRTTDDDRTAHADYIAALRSRSGSGPVPGLLADLLEMHDATALSLDDWTAARAALAEAFQGTGTPFVLKPNGA